MTTIYSFAKKCMNDKEFNCGGIVSNEKYYLDAIGLDYIEEDGCITTSGYDLTRFYEAMETLRQLQRKYSK